MSGASPQRGALGLLGGTFDPIHIGHLRLAIEVVEAFALPELRFIPAATPNLRDPPSVDAAGRLGMIQAALGGSPVLTADDREISRGGVSYTVDTLQSVRSECGDRPLLFVIGMDTFHGLPRWHRWRDVLTLAHIVVVTRPEAPAPAGELTALLDEAGTPDKRELLETPAGRISIQHIPMLPIASTDIRRRIREGRSIRHLVPDAVDDIIRTYGYYAC